jgi:hypothetical protein
MFKKLLPVFALLYAAFAQGAPMPVKLPFTIEPLTPRCVEIGKKTVMTLTAENFDIVDAGRTPTSKFAAREIAEALSAVFNTKLAVQRKAGKKPFQICVGDRKLAQTLKIDPARFDRDGFVIRTAGNKILIIGHDHPKNDPYRTAYGGGDRGERGTLFGAYDFLERFAGVRYFFPGKLGTVTPLAQKLEIPAINIYDRPEFIQRRFNDYNYGQMPIQRYDGWDGRLNNLRNRKETFEIPNCHGLAYLGYVQRFAKSHPEYFLLKKDGTRHDGSVIVQPSNAMGHLCYSSPIKEEIIKDAISFFKKEPPTVRGVLNRRGQSSWGMHSLTLPFFNIMLNDCSGICYCEKCWKYFSQGPQATSNFLWKFFNDISNAVKKAGVPGYLTTMAYGEYRLVPDMKIADNLLVMLALRGPWNEYLPEVQKQDMELLKKWYNKLGQKTWLWTYPGKYYGQMQGIPHTTPRSLASFIKKARPYIFGLYIECESDVLIFNYLTYYIFGKLAWNPDADVEALLEDHVRSFYGPAAAPMKTFFDTIEKKWQQIAANVVETAEGPKTIYPTELILWGKIYSPQVLKELDSLFDKAEKLAAKEKTYLDRVRFIRKEFFGATLKAAAVFNDMNSAAKAWRFPMTRFTGKGVPAAKDWNAAQKLWLSGLMGKPAEVKTAVRVLYDEKNFYFRFDCDEPFTDKIQSEKRAHDGRVWDDSDIEIFISPDGSRDRYYQIMVNPSGSVADVTRKQVVDFKWQSGAKVNTGIIPRKGWFAEVILPRSSMPDAMPDGILAEFSRQRALKNVKFTTNYYAWSPFARHFGDINRFGALTFKAEPDNNVARNSDLDPKKMSGTWQISKKAFRDDKLFVTNNSAVRLTAADPSSFITQSLYQLKPETEYEVSFFARMDNVKMLEGKASGFYLRFDYGNGKPTYFPKYPARMDGSCPWTGFKFKVRTPKDLNARKAYIIFTLRKATGTVWIDEIKINEIRKK